jgi:hypothetical protein
MHKNQKTMARSPSHKFGQDLGNLLEEILLDDILKPRLLEFAQAQNYDLDWQRSRATFQSKTLLTEFLRKL